MPKISGQCLCGSVSYQADTEIKMIINCHCSDCRQATGSVYGTMVFVAEDKVAIEGTPSEFQHPADSGNVLTKVFCPNCGSQVIGRNSAREGVIGIRAGTISQKELVRPGAEVFCGNALPSTPMNPDTKKFEKMPG